jgi:hypothetical protein
MQLGGVTNYKNFLLIHRREEKRKKGQEKFTSYE